MKISADKVKLCYTLYEDSPLYQLMETPLEIYELPHWDFRLERTEGKYYDYIYKIIYLERTSNNPNSEYVRKIADGIIAFARDYDLLCGNRLQYVFKLLFGFNCDSRSD